LSVAGALISAGSAAGATLLDHTFGTAGRVHTNSGPNTNPVVHAVAIQPDGKILVGGEVCIGSNPRRSGLIRYLPDGSVDSTFGIGGTVNTVTAKVGSPAVRAIAVQPDGKIVVGSYGWCLGLIRYLPDGSIDPTFSGIDKLTGRISLTGGSFLTCDLALQADGKIVICGTHYRAVPGGNRGYINCLRFNADGTPDTTFNGTGKVEFSLGDHCYVQAVAIQSDGRIVLAGDTRYFTTPRQMDATLVRLMPDGSLDTSFNGTGVASHRLGGANSRGTSLALQPDGKIVLGGGRATGPGETEFFNERHGMLAARYNPDGSLDPSFNGAGFNMADFGGDSRDDVESVLLQGSRVVLVGTRFRKVQFVPNGSDFALAAFDANGALDGTFNVGGLALTDFNKGHEYCGAGVLQADGKVIAAGFTIEPTTNKTGTEVVLARYNIDGATTAAEDDGGGQSVKGPPTVTDEPDSQVVPLGGALNLYAAHGGSAPFTYQWMKNGKSIPGATGQSYSIPMGVTNADAGKYAVRITNAKGSRTTKPAYVAVIDTEPLDLNVEEGYPTSISARAVVPPGSPVSYLWHFNGEPLQNGPRVQGVKTATLKLLKPAPSDEGTFSCLVHMGDGVNATTYNQSDTFVTIVPADIVPVIDPFTLATATVNNVIQHIVTAPGARSFSAIGLPPGVELDSVTGVLSGSPTRAKIVGGVAVPYSIKFIAANHAGKSDPVTVSWLIEPIPASLAGTYDATATSTNLRITVTNQGVLSGALTLNRQVFRFTTAFKVAAGGLGGNAQVTLKRSAKQAPLTLTIAVDGVSGDLNGSVNDSGASTVLSGARLPSAKLAAR
jgi:uncharacterized delta-60 repeat protein